MDMIQSLVNWFLAHEVVMGGAAIGLLDFIFAMKSSWASNGVLHFIYVSAAKMAGKSV